MKTEAFFDFGILELRNFEIGGTCVGEGNDDGGGCRF